MATDRKPRKPAPAKGGARKGKDTRKPGRPTIYSAKACEVVCLAVASGMPLELACEEAGAPSKATVMRWLLDPEKVEFRDQYTRARELCADSSADRVAAIGYRVLPMGRRKGVPFQAARVAMDAAKWTAEKMNAKKYGTLVKHGDAEGNNLPAPQWIVQPVAPPPRLEDDLVPMVESVPVALPYDPNARD